MKKLSFNYSRFILLAGISGLAIFFVSLMFGFSEKQNNTEKLLGLTMNYDKKEVTIHVVTSGCTVKADFGFKISNNTITISRKKRDLCKALPQATAFTYTMKEVAIDPNKLYAIKNMFIANPNLANIP